MIDHPIVAFCGSTQIGNRIGNHIGNKMNLFRAITELVLLFTKCYRLLKIGNTIGNSNCLRPCQRSMTIPPTWSRFCLRIETVLWRR
jgi:hypothetical protein